MHARTCCPAEHEKASGQGHDGDERGNKAVFGATEAVLLDVWDEVLELVDEEHGYADDTGEADRDEAEACLTEVEVVDWWIDEGEHFKEGVVDAVGE